MKVHYMATTLRLNDQEQDEIRKKAIKINKMLVSFGKQPLRDSELIHKILEKTIPYLDVEGDDIVIREEDGADVVIVLDSD